MNGNFEFCYRFQRNGCPFCISRVFDPNNCTNSALRDDLNSLNYDKINDESS